MHGGLNLLLQGLADHPILLSLVILFLWHLPWDTWGHNTMELQLLGMSGAVGACLRGDAWERCMHIHVARCTYRKTWMVSLHVSQCTSIHSLKQA